MNGCVPGPRTPSRRRARHGAPAAGGATSSPAQVVEALAAAVSQQFAGLAAADAALARRAVGSFKCSARNISNQR